MFYDEDDGAETNPTDSGVGSESEVDQKEEVQPDEIVWWLLGRTQYLWKVCTHTD